MGMREYNLLCFHELTQLVTKYAEALGDLLFFIKSGAEHERRLEGGDVAGFDKQ